ncbi:MULTISPECIES: hypothetical protein [Streptomyces]|uniref:Uncharacterized protein n=2 Tax=Streptomyces rhizosphaericus TaxID=114699 RepID=A0ABN1SPL7_9ACTN|nr:MULTISPECIES: hypothetical protein [Streptomyces]MCG0285252.1 hypothetical protein [Streptomyces sp. PSAA01]
MCLAAGVNADVLALLDSGDRRLHALLLYLAAGLDARWNASVTRGEHD